jgi:heme/copper-type cytochrome/quinol oxidase subunit 3
LVCIGVLFLVFLGLALAVWKSSPTWPPPGAPRPPQGLLASTLLLLACSVALAHSLGAHRRGDPSGVKVGTFAALGLGLLFLICQGLLWREFLGLGIPASNGYVALFFALTGLHALHIAGGIVFLVRVLTELYMAGDGLGSATALRLCGAYWHAMGAIWVVLFAVLYVLR